MVIKCEANEQGTNRRIVVTTRAGAEQYPDGTYQEYGDRGESENRNKELTVDLCAARVVTTTRKIHLLIPSSWPHFDYLIKVRRSLAAFSPSG